MAGRICEADFETTTDPADCRVWAWGVCFVDDLENVFYGTDIDSFLLFVARENRLVCNFHNLAFDGRFLVDRLLRLGYKHTTDRFIRAGQFSTMVSSKGRFYQIEVRFYNGVLVTIRDSLKLYPMAVRQVARAFNLEEGKGELDYDKKRELGHRLTEEERDYIRRDVQIVARALDIGLSQGLTKMTIGSNAMADFKQRLGRGRFKKLFPVLDADTDAFIRKSYRGGFTYVNPAFAGRDVFNGISVDYNSMYPSMLISKAYPVGRPRRFEGQYKGVEGYPLYVQGITATFKLKARGIPMIQLRGFGFFGEHEYVRETAEPVSIVLTSVDLELFMDNYDVDVWSWDGGFCFQACHGSEIFGDYVDYWGEVKRNNKGALRTLAKLYLNNLYGKFSTHPDVTQKVPYLDEETDTVKWRLGEHEEREPVYIPVGSFCTAYARDTLIRAIMCNYDRFVYCDTDSMHLRGLWAPADIRLHDTDFCAWKVEGSFWRARHLRAKCYIWDLNHELSVTCAGMPDNIKEHCTFDNFYFGFNNLEQVTHDDGTTEVRVRDGWAKLTPVAVPGGVVLRDGPYRLKP